MSGDGSPRARLLAVTGELLDAEGLEGVSLREIARRAGVSHGAPLRHFPSLASLLAHVSAEGFRRLSDAVAAGAASSGPSARDRLAGAGRAYCRFGLTQPGLLTLMFRWDLVDRGEPELSAASHEAFDRFTELVAAAQAEGWQPGWEPKLLAGALWSAVHGLASLWVPGALQRPTGATELEEILGPLLAIIVYPEGATRDVLDRGP
jgi:AcrR family transcriptional regulator